jgi:basic membrane protein A
VKAKLAEIDAGTLVVFKGPIVDQNGTVVIPEGAVLTPDKMSGVDWFVKGVVGSPK